jgi:hypothetical protein
MKRRNAEFIYEVYDLTDDEVKLIDPEFEMSEEEYEKFEM